MRRLHTLGLVLAVTLGLACGKTANERGEQPTNTAQGGSSSAVGGAGGANDTLCTGPHPGPGPLSRLDGYELNRSVQDAVREAPELVDPAKLFERNVTWDRTSDVSPAFVLTAHALAHDVALRLSHDGAALRAISGCELLARSDATCKGQFLERFLKRTYRRAVTDEDRSEMNAVFTEGEKLGGDFASGVRAVVEVALQSPDFTYLIELGQEAGSGDTVSLSGYETAARLAYFLTGSPPDDELLAAAEQGALDSGALEAQATRLLGSPKSREQLRHFYAKLLPLTGQAPKPLPGYTAQIVELAQEETGRFIEDVTFDGAGTFRALLTEPTTWVNEPLARFYGYPAVSGDAFQKVQLDPSRRMGIFTQSAFLSGTSYSLQSNPVLRGLSILRQVLCYETPPPPPDVISAPAPPSEGGTNRQRLEVATSDPACQSCHRDINPVGFAFEHYDAVGLWRDTDNGAAIDSSGELYRTDAKGRFNHALGLLQRIAESNDAKACFVGHWLTDAYRREEGPEDACARAEVSEAFAESDGNVVQLILALTRTDSFRYRLKSELAPRL